MNALRSFVAEFDSPPPSPTNNASTDSYYVRPKMHQRQSSGSFSSDSALNLAENAFSGFRRGIRSGAGHVSRASRDLLMSPSSPIHELLNSPFHLPTTAAYMGTQQLYAPPPPPQQKEIVSRLDLREATFSLGDESGSATPMRTPRSELGGNALQLDTGEDDVPKIQYAILPPDSPNLAAVDLASPTLSCSIALPEDTLIPGHEPPLVVVDALPPVLNQPSGLQLEVNPPSEEASAETANDPSTANAGKSSDTTEAQESLATYSFPPSTSTSTNIEELTKAIESMRTGVHPSEPTVGQLSSRRPSLTIEIPTPPSFEFEEAEGGKAKDALARVPSTINEASSAVEKASDDSEAALPATSDVPELAANPEAPQTTAQRTQSIPAENIAAADQIEIPPIPAPSQEALLLQAVNDLFVQHAELETGVSDLKALETFLRTSSHQNQQLKLLRGQLEQQNERAAELREAHKSELLTLSTEADNLRKQVSAHSTEMTKANATVKEEEEKRAKSISLLKALRQKLMKAEAIKEDSEKALEREKTNLISERSRWETDVLGLKAENQNQLTRLRTGFEREVNSLRAQYEREAQVKKAQFELEAVTLKASYARELSQKETKAKEAEARVVALETEHESIFQTNQEAAAKLESTKEHNDALEARLAERDLELQEAHQREEAANESLRASQRVTPIDEPSPSASRALYEAEARSATRISQLEAKIKQLEKARGETDEEMSRNMEQRLNEVERMRREIARRDAEFEEQSRSADERQRKAEAIENKVQELDDRAKGLEGLLELSRDETSRVADRLESIREELHDRDVRISELEGRLEEVNQRENQLRAGNKTMRDELRKVQSGILLSEKSRGPGIGYFSNFASSSPNLHSNNPTAPSTPLPQPAEALPSPKISKPSSPRASTTSMASSAETKQEEAINFEYIRNVILQFLEHKEMRPHLVGVLGVILHFTPQETRRLSSKAAA